MESNYAGYAMPKTSVDEPAQLSLISEALDALQKQALNNAEILQALSARLMPVSVDTVGEKGSPMNSAPKPIESKMLQEINIIREELEAQYVQINRLISGLQI